MMNWKSCRMTSRRKLRYYPSIFRMGGLGKIAKPQVGVTSLLSNSTTQELHNTKQDSNLRSVSFGMHVSIYAPRHEDVWGACSAPRPGRFNPKERVPGIHWIRGRVRPRVGLDAVAKIKIPSHPWQDSNPRCPAPASVLKASTRS
jgi:hypothetical protein